MNFSRGDDKIQIFKAQTSLINKKTLDKVQFYIEFVLKNIPQDIW